MRGTIAMRGRRILVAWTLAGKGDRIVADLTKFLESFEIPPPPPRSETVIAAEETPRTLAPVTETRTDTAPAPAHTDIAMTTTVTRVYASNKTRKYYPLDCKAAPPDAFPMAKSLAVKQGFTPAPECPQ
jgi:hypothetical protein